MAAAAEGAGRRQRPYPAARRLAVGRPACHEPALEGLGLLRADLDREPFWQPPAGLTSLGLTDDEAWSSVQELLRTVRN
ncbi:hypothetical protein ABZ690_35330 [Streptomyces sp. NPDC006967]